MSHKEKDREIIDYLNDINDSISDILNFTADISFEEFEVDKKTQHAVIQKGFVQSVHCDYINPSISGLPPDAINLVTQEFVTPRCLPTSAPE